MLRAVVLLAVLLAPGIGVAADNAAPPDGGIRVDASGRLVGIDPALRAELLAQLRATLLANGTPAQSGPVRVLADGAEAMTLGSEHVTFVVARVADDDTLETSCIRGADATATFLAQSGNEQAAAAPTAAQ